jgi:N-acetylglucosaminyl-diphospho-decaprenol L-rhamnosyltransferase
MKSEKVTILIVNWNAGDYLLRCLQTIDPRYPVVLVDNHSQDDSALRAAAAFPIIKLIESPVNLGFSAGNNLGLKDINTEYTLFLNPDTEIIGDAIEDLVEFLDNHPNYDAVGPRIIEADGRFSIVSGRRHFNLWFGFCQAFLLYRLFPRSRWFSGWFLPEWDQLNSRDVECLVGCAMLMRTAVVKKLGGFDESVPLFLDDVDLCRKITDRGGKIRCLVTANIRHIHNVSGSKAPGTWITHLSHMARYLYLQKHASKLQAALYRSYLALAGILRVLLFAGACLIDRRYSRSLKISWDMLTFALIYCGSEQLQLCSDYQKPPFPDLPSVPGTHPGEDRK